MRTTIIASLILLSLVAEAQTTDKLTLEQAVEAALKNNAGVKAAGYEVESQKQLKKTSFDLPKTSVSLLYGQYNSYAKNDNNITISQAIPFTALRSQSALNRSLLVASQMKKAVTENELVFQVKQVYYQIAFEQARRDLLLQQDTIFTGFLKSASFRYKTGEGNLLEQTTAETQSNDIKNQLHQNQADIIVLRTQLRTLLNSAALPDISENSLKELSLQEIPDSTALSANPALAYVRQQVDVAKSEKKLENAKFAPDLLLGYFNQTLIDVVNTENGAVATNADRFTGLQVGLALPLWFAPHLGRAKAASFNHQAAQSNYKSFQITLQGQWQQAAQQYSKNKSSLDYYKTSALPNADLILKQSQAAFRGGEIDFAAYLLGVRNAISLKEGYLKTLNDYNQSIIYIEFLSGSK